MTEPRAGPEEAPNENDRVLALVGYLVPVVALVVLLTEMGLRRFVRYHAVQALVYVGMVAVVWFALALLTAFAALVTFPIGGIGGYFVGLWLLLAMLAAGVVALLYGLQAYQGKYLEIPWVTSFARQQGWL